MGCSIFRMFHPSHTAQRRHSMNFRRTFSLIVLFIFLPFFGSCTTAGSYLFPPAYSMSITNNLLDVSVDILWNGEIQKKGLLTGETYKFELWSFRSEGMRFNFVAKGYRGGKYIGITSRDGYVYNQYAHDEWKIEDLSLAREVINRGP